jgi:phenylpyruvate tautomerase PptA (4-oxalocrotonate tautomerase family)
MPVISVSLLPLDLHQEEYEGLVESVRETVTRVLELKETDVSVLLPSDLCNKGLGEEIIVSISGLFDQPDRTAELKQRLCEEVAKTVWEFAEAHVPQCERVEVINLPFNRAKDGFCALVLNRVDDI